MPHFCFTFEPSQAGCAQRVCLFSPWAQPTRGPNGQPLNPPEAAWLALQQYAQSRNSHGQPFLIIPPGVAPKVICTNPGGQGDQFNVYCVQKADPEVSRTPIHAPYGSPLASGHSMAPPPLPSKERTVPQGMYDELPDCALASSSDSVLGEMDAAGGTYSDLDSQGREIPRQNIAPYSPKVAGR